MWQHGTARSMRPRSHDDKILSGEHCLWMDGPRLPGGEGGIRTHEPLAQPPVFKGHNAHGGILGARGSNTAKPYIPSLLGCPLAQCIAARDTVLRSYWYTNGTWRGRGPAQLTRRASGASAAAAGERQTRPLPA